MSAVIVAQMFTLAWTHSVEKVRWEEDWQIVDRHLHLAAARIRGTGAGMEPPPDAVLRDGIWHYRPAVAPLGRLTLADSSYSAAYELCLGATCRPLRAYLSSSDAVLVSAAPVILTSCRPPDSAGRRPPVGTSSSFR